MKHISAEQKRRFNIKMGFNTLNSLICNNSKLVGTLALCGVGARALSRCLSCLLLRRPATP